MSNVAWIALRPILLRTVDSSCLDGLVIEQSTDEGFDLGERCEGVGGVRDPAVGRAGDLQALVPLHPREDLLERRREPFWPGR